MDASKNSDFLQEQEGTPAWGQRCCCEKSTFLEVPKCIKRYLENMSMKIRPLHDRVVVRRKEEEAKTAGGIVLPGSAKEKPNQGVVVAVGSGRVLDNGDVRPVDVKEGDLVVFGKYAGSDTIEVEGEELIILSESDIKAVVE